MKAVKKWDELARTWSNTGSPASPSFDDITSYKKLIFDNTKTILKPSIMILGSTPKLRSLFIEDKTLSLANITCVDFSEKMYNVTSSYISNKNSNEVLVIDDWLNMDLSNKKYSVILGDKVIDNISTEERRGFLQNIHKHLAIKGVFITRLGLQNQELSNYDIFSSLKRWGIGATEKSATKLASGFWEEILGASSLYQGERYKTQKVSRFIHELDTISKNINTLTNTECLVFSKFVELFWSSLDNEWTSYDLETIALEAKKWFFIEKVIYSKDYIAAKNQPVVCMKRVSRSNY